MPRLIGIDWGTSNCRAFLLGDGGAVLERRASPLGILNVPNGDFAAAFAEIAAGWAAPGDAVPILLSGMIGSRQGWREAPYVALPAGAAELAGTLAEVETPLGPARIVPGLVGEAVAGGRDVIRGEETQVLGALESGPVSGGDGVFCLPGTHSKWIRVEGGRVARFATFMTGEVFGVLRRHSILGRLMQGEGPHPSSFAAGVARSGAAGGLLHQLFGVRTEGLFGGIPPEGLADFLSGLLVGDELRHALPLLPAGAAPVLIGAEPLTARYGAALAQLGRPCGRRDGEEDAARGLWNVARAAGIVADWSGRT